MEMLNTPKKITLTTVSLWREKKGREKREVS